MKPLAANTLLQNRYLIVHLIGKGGMGDVYLAIDQRLGSAVALKRTFFSGDEIFAEAFEREARTLARLKHGALPKVTDHFIEGEMQFLIMEHIAGEDLAKRLELSQKPFPIEWVMFWADQLLDALNYLHSQEPPVIHRDIKPQNLKLTDDNSVILLDFGLSKNTVAETRAAATTGSVVGYTPHFAPLEQIRGTGTNPRSDIYSLSATLYQLLTNVVPPETLVRAENILSGKPDPIKPVIEINNQVSQAVSDIILKGMEVSQEKRFATAREMQRNLREAYTQNQARDSKQIETFTLPYTSNSQVSNSALKTNVGSLSSNVSYSPQSSPRENSVQAADVAVVPPKKKSQAFFLTIIALAVPLLLAIAGIGWLLKQDSATNTKKNASSNASNSPFPQPTATTITVENTNLSEANNLADNTESQNNAESSNENSNPRIQNAIEKLPKTTQNSTIKSSPKQSERPKAITKTTPKPTPSSKATPLPRILP